MFYREHKRVTTDFDTEAFPSLTKQSFKDEANINNIVNKYIRTGELPEHHKLPKYGDLTQIPDYKEAMVTVAHGRHAFEQLPSDLRARFANDPGQFLEFVANEENNAELLKLGIIQPKQAEDPPKVEKPEPKISDPEPASEPVK